MLVFFFFFFWTGLQITRCKVAPCITTGQSIKWHEDNQRPGYHTRAPCQGTLKNLPGVGKAKPFFKIFVFSPSPSLPNRSGTRRLRMNFPFFKIKIVAAARCFHAENCIKNRVARQQICIHVKVTSNDTERGINQRFPWRSPILIVH